MPSARMCENVDTCFVGRQCPDLDNLKQAFAEIVQLKGGCRTYRWSAGKPFVQTRRGHIICVRLITSFQNLAQRILLSRQQRKATYCSSGILVGLRRSSFALDALASSHVAGEACSVHQVLECLSTPPGHQGITCRRRPFQLLL